MAFAMLVSASLYHTALNHSVRIDRKHRASQALERRIEEIRSWSQKNHGTHGALTFSNDSDWSVYRGQSQDPVYPEFDLITEIEPHDLLSPSSAFEAINFAAQSDSNVPLSMKDKEKIITGSAYRVTVTGKWGDNPHDSLTVHTIIADPVKDYGWTQNDAWKAITIESTPSIPTELARTKELRFTATIKDANGHPVKNAVIQWYVDPDSSGRGTIEIDPSTSAECVFRNEVRVVTDPEPPVQDIVTFTGGSVRIVARARLGGIEAINKTAKIKLEGPNS